MIVEKEKTITELAKDAFNKTETLRMMQMQNTPIDYKEREEAFIKLALARANVTEANQKLNDAIEGKVNG